MKNTTIFLSMFISSIGLFLGLVCLFKWVNGDFEGYEKDCNYCVKEPYSLVYSPSEGKYAIKDGTYSDYYLIKYSNRIDGMFLSIREPTMFKDSCEAKGFLKYYLTPVNNLKVKDFKELPRCP